MKVPGCWKKVSGRIPKIATHSDQISVARATLPQTEDGRAAGTLLGDGVGVYAVGAEAHGLVPVCTRHK
eukprot:5384719-Pyramimonas_sp.AAC.1